MNRCLPSKPFASGGALCQNPATPAKGLYGENAVTSEEIGKLQAYFRRLFGNDLLQVRARPKKDDSCELYKEDEFLGVIYKDEDDDYNFSMAILDVDLD